MNLIKLIFKKIIRSNKKSNLKENVEYFDTWANTYDKFLFSWFIRRAQQKSIDLINKKNFYALDVSCGTGEGLLMLRKKTDGKLVGIDISSAMIKKAKNKVKNVELKKANVDHIPYKNESFDVVISTEAFHHYLNPKQAINEMKRVLKENGELIITDVNFHLSFLNRLFERIEPGCVNIYSTKQMKNLFFEAGFKQVQQKKVFMNFFITKGIK